MFGSKEAARSPRIFKRRVDARGPSSSFWCCSADIEKVIAVSPRAAPIERVPDEPLPKNVPDIDEMEDFMPVEDDEGEEVTQVGAEASVVGGVLSLFGLGSFDLPKPTPPKLTKESLDAAASAAVEARLKARGSSSASTTGAAAPPSNDGGDNVAIAPTQELPGFIACVGINEVATTPLSTFMIWPLFSKEPQLQQSTKNGVEFKRPPRPKRRKKVLK